MVRFTGLLRTILQLSYGSSADFWRETGDGFGAKVATLTAVRRSVGRGVLARGNAGQMLSFRANNSSLEHVRLGVKSLFRRRLPISIRKFLILALVEKI